MSKQNNTPELETELALDGTDARKVAELRSALEAAKVGDAPNELETSAAALFNLATREDCEISGHLANDGARHFKAALATLRACRLALDLIEAKTIQAACEDAAWHRENLDAWHAVDVVPAPELATA